MDLYLCGCFLAAGLYMGTTPPNGTNERWVWLCVVTIASWFSVGIIVGASLWTMSEESKVFRVIKEGLMEIKEKREGKDE